MTMKGFPRLLVPRPPAGVRPGEKPSGYVKPPEPEAVMHACRPVEHVKPPPRIVPTSSGPPVRPVPPPPPEIKKPAFLTRGTAAEKTADERQTEGLGNVSTPPARHTVTFPARPRTPNGFKVELTAPAGTRQTGGIGRVTTEPATPTIRIPTTSAPAHKGYLGRMDRIDPDEIPF